MKFGDTFLAVVCMFSSYFFASITFDDGFFPFQDNKVSLMQARGHNHENMIFQLWQYPFRLKDEATLNLLVFLPSLGKS